MSGPCLLVTFCNQLTSPQYAALLLQIGGNGRDWLLPPEPGITDAGLAGLTGVCPVGRDLVLTTQSATPEIILYDPLERRIKACRELSPCLDPHSLIYHAGSLYVVSTGTNEIYEVSLGAAGFGAPRLHWRYPEVPNDRDLVHLNGLTASADGLIASCFGPRGADGSWGRMGAVFQLEPFAVIQGGLAQPHTPLCHGGRLYFAESQAHLVHSLRRDEDGAWRAQGRIDVGGYTRGLAVAEDRLWVGVSAPRLISRSKGTPNQGVAAATSGAALICIDLARQRVTGRTEVGGFGEEVYDLLILEQPGPLGDPADALSRRILNMHRVAARLRGDHAATTRRLLTDIDNLLTESANLTAELDRRVQEIGRQLSEIADLRLTRAALEAQLISVREALDSLHLSHSWRITAPLRYVSGLFRRGR